EGSVFADAPIIPCSAVTRAGVDELRAAVRRALRTLPGRPTADCPILPIDRAFVMKGHGTVVTGTLLTGTLRAEEPLTVVPVGHREPRVIRVRSVQVRGAETAHCKAGTRTALNIANVATAELHRGDVITAGDRVTQTDTLHAVVEHLTHDPHPWTNQTCVELCAGTAHCTARLDPLTRDPEDEGERAAGNEDDVVIAPGQRGVVRLRLDAPIPAWHGMRVILRGFHDASADGPQRRHGYTLGGGVVVDPRPSGGRGQRRRWRALTNQLRRGEPGERVGALLVDAGALGISRTELALRAGITGAALDEALQPLTTGARPEVVTLASDRFVTEAVLPPITARAIELVDRYHDDHPMQPGMSRAAVEGSIPGRVATDVALVAIERAVAAEELYPVGDQGLLARPGRGPEAGYAPSVQRVLEQYARAGIEPPTVKQVETATGLPARRVIEALSVLQKDGALTRVTNELSMARESHEELMTRVRAHLREHDEIDVQALKNMTGLSRKFVVPLLEHLDRIGVTRRDGDRRVPGPRA
ncbi:MAG: SelB C-terminal domain-containing protein, partial [Myxococcales bacterium]|nr:SelB C-terminal domain-containing protein [Myxococcales bacterium]